MEGNTIVYTYQVNGKTVTSTPFVPLSDFLKLVDTFIDLMNDGQFHKDIADNFLGLIRKYGYDLNEEGLLCKKGDV